ncbi:response regulator [Bdellovibrio sp. SKB1291214]|uniref:ATP-binding protein n=1 Tax=Bdellovibrio sp. SKB1291214 TaxID=1732569 RepID=UPI000B518968|nr:ATP-binding protein [Bdellovibrio sp. SKB1291214]UYL07754.1 response regulator [Bdellovibrio sp. SKB1291214]
MSGQFQLSEIEAEMWKYIFFATHVPILITTLDERVLQMNDSARDLLSFEGDIGYHKLEGLLARLKPSLRQMIRLQKVLAPAPYSDHLLVYLQNTRENYYAERLLTFYATTLKSLDRNFDLTACANQVASGAAMVAIESMADWCRIDLREDLGVGKGTVAHNDESLLPYLKELQDLPASSFDEVLSPMRVLRSGAAVFQEDVAHELFLLLSGSPQIYDLYTKVGLRSYICVPIKQNGDTIGSMTWARGPSNAHFDAVDMMMAEEFANKLAVNLERALLYKNLAEMKDAAEAANRAKTNFIANVSHEIRTPLGAIIGFSDLLTGSASTLLERQEWASKVRTNSNYLLRIIDDILDISKVEAGKVELEITEIDLRELLREMKLFADSRVENKDVQFKVAIQGPSPRFIKSDPTRLSQVLSNLIGNAIKFTSSGFVTLTVSKLETHESLSFEIADSGIGISSAQAEILFQPFTQADASHTRQFGGTGLGLALSRTLARRLGGDLVLMESELGRGSTFLVTIESVSADDGPSFTDLLEQEGERRVQVLDVTAISFSDTLKGREILLVEDSTDIQVLIKRFLEGAGAVISIAHNGEECVQMASQKTFDVILMDVQMPVKDGCQAASELRASGYSNLIVALTANAMKEERERCLAAGYDAHLSKPIRRHDLIQKLMGFLGESKNARTSESLRPDF